MVRFFVDLGGRDRKVLLAELKAQKVQDAIGIHFGRADIQADFAHGSTFSDVSRSGLAYNAMAAKATGASGKRISPSHQIFEQLRNGRVRVSQHRRWCP